MLRKENTLNKLNRSETSLLTACMTLSVIMGYLKIRSHTRRFGQNNQPHFSVAPIKGQIVDHDLQYISGESGDWDTD